MKKFACLLLLFIAAQSLTAQPYKVKTIFELLNIQNNSRTISTEPAADGKIEDDESVFSSVDMAVEDVSIVNNGDAPEATELMVKYLKKNPAGRNPLAPAHIAYLSENHDSWLQVTDKGYQVEQRDESIKDLGPLFYVSRNEYDHYGFNAINEKNKSVYYSRNGNPLLQHIFQFVQQIKGNYFIFYEGKKAGIADSLGRILLPPKYDDALAFTFRDKTYFSVKEGTETWFLDAAAKPVLRNKTGNCRILPAIIANRYWHLDGKLYDMQEKKQLFYGLGYAVMSDDEDYPVFYIKRRIAYSREQREGDYDKGIDDNRDDYEEIYFDAAGNLLCGQPLRNASHLADTLIYAAIFLKDTLFKNNRYSIHRYGLLNFRYQWKLQPDYVYMSELHDRSNTVRFMKKFGEENKPGLIGPDGKVWIPEGKYQQIAGAGMPGKFIGYKEGGSILIDVNNGTTRTLEKNFIEVRSFFSQYETSLLRGYVPNDVHYLLDTNYRIVDTTEWSDIDIAGRSDRFLRFFPMTPKGRQYEEERHYKTWQLEPIKVNYQGEEITSFMEVDSLAPGMYFYQRKRKPSIVQTSPGVFFETNKEYLRYDPFYQWFIVMDNKTRGWGILDKQGNELLPCTASEIRYYTHQYGGALVKYGRGETQMIERNGKFLFDRKYESITPVTADFFMVKKNGKYGLLKRSGEEIIPVIYSYMVIKQGLIWYGTSEALVQSMPVGELKAKR